MTEKECKKRCYEIYQLEQMKRHKYSLEKMINGLKNYLNEKLNCFEDYKTNNYNEITVDMKEYFGKEDDMGKIFATEEDFCNREYKNVKYMRSILPKDILNHYNYFALKNGYIESKPYYLFFSDEWVKDAVFRERVETDFTIHLYFILPRKYMMEEFKDIDYVELYVQIEKSPLGHLNILDSDIIGELGTKPKYKSELRPMRWNSGTETYEDVIIEEGLTPPIMSHNRKAFDALYELSQKGKGAIDKYISFPDKLFKRDNKFISQEI